MTGLAGRFSRPWETVQGTDLKPSLAITIMRR